MTVKTVVVAPFSKAQQLCQSTNTPAVLVDLFHLDDSGEKCRMNLHQKQGTCPDAYREYIKKTFSEMEIKSMY